MSDAFGIPASDPDAQPDPAIHGRRAHRRDRLAIIAAWGCVVLVEWFGSNEGAGFRARYWYQWRPTTTG